MEKNLYICTNGNDEQVKFILRMFESFLVNNDTDYCIHQIVITDQLKRENKLLLHKCGIEIVSIQKNIVENFNKVIGSNLHPLGKIAKPFFLDFFLNKIDHNALCIYCDPDMLLLTELSKLLSLNKYKLITVSQSLLPTASHTCSRRLEKVKKAGILKNIEIPRTQPEICTGFFMGQRNLILDLLKGWINFMLEETFNSLKDKDENGMAWHDQDFFRLYHLLNDSLNLNVLSPTDIIITNPPANLLYNFECKGNSVKNIDITLPPSTLPPLMVHFAGGTYKKYPDIMNLYGLD